MNDRMDLWLRRLPDNGPAPDLAARIMLAIEERGRLKARWRKLAIAAGALGVVGLTLMILSWSAVEALPTVPDGAAVLEAIGEFLLAPLDTLGGSAEAVVVWESSLAEGIEIAFVVGAVLLTLGAVGGLARLLRKGEAWNRVSP